MSERMNHASPIDPSPSSVPINGERPGGAAAAEVARSAVVSLAGAVRTAQREDERRTSLRGISLTEMSCQDSRIDRLIAGGLLGRPAAEGL